ncbi:MAG: hypothetical protein B6U95_04450 [Thermofilum sp. ex4484_82]|nr:MAG: hypothetical protein B6U95_04450 [Thermofilum sp. ex4484_82]OYT38437.1 MAG: hypothetical protein B6U96_04445 [Archaeoglobales archaeon ex4484_92]
MIISFYNKFILLNLLLYCGGKMALPPPPQPSGPAVAAGEYTPSDDEKLFGLISWIIPIIGSIIVMVTKKESKFALFHAKQALIVHLVFLALYILTGIGGFILTYLIGLGFLLWLLDLLFLLIQFLIAVYGAFMAYQGKWLKLPVVSNIAQKF